VCALFLAYVFEQFMEQKNSPPQASCVFLMPQVTRFKELSVHGAPKLR
jgi:hypothetical protein